MASLADLKTATKIFLLIFVAAVFLGIVGFVGYHYSNKISDNMSAMYKDRLLPIKWLNAMRGQTRAVEAATIGLTHPSFSKADEQKAVQEIRERAVEVDKLWGDYTKTNLGPYEKERIAQFEQSLRAWRETRGKVQEMALNGQKAEAYLYFTQNAAQHIDKINVLLKDLADYNAKMADEQEAQGDRDAAMAAKIIVVTTIIAMIISLMFGWMVARMIANPLKSMLAGVQAVAAGDLSVKALNMKAEDEVGQLAKAFDTMTANLRLVVKQVIQSSEQVAASSEELTASAEQTAQAATQVAQTITDVTRGAEKQLKAVDDTASVVTQMSAGIQQVAANANHVAGQSAAAADKAKSGGQAVDKAVGQMTQIETTSKSVAEAVAKLGEQSKEIGQIVGTIAGIAGQTNLLALNAAIEAARAGEQGRGFAVVAEEVRKLAEESEEAAKKIAELVRDIQRDTDKAVAAMDAGAREVKTGTEVVTGAGAAFREIVVLVSEVSSQVREISAAVQQMASGSQQIVASVKDIDAISKDTAGQAQTVSAATEEQSATMEEIASSSQSLAKLAEELRAAVAKFRV